MLSAIDSADFVFPIADCSGLDDVLKIYDANEGLGDLERDNKPTFTKVIDRNNCVQL